MELPLKRFIIKYELFPNNLYKILNANETISIQIYFLRKLSNKLNSTYVSVHLNGNNNDYIMYVDEEVIKLIDKNNQIVNQQWNNKFLKEINENSKV